jgi:hypothetical protein
MEYNLTNFMLLLNLYYVKGNFNNVTIYLAIHSHSALIFRLRCISIERKKILHLREELKHMTFVRIFFYLSLKYNSYFHILWFL